MIWRFYVEATDHKSRSGWYRLHYQIIQQGKQTKQLTAQNWTEPRNIYADRVAKNESQARQCGPRHHILPMLHHNHQTWWFSKGQCSPTIHHTRTLCRQLSF